ncbi:hypothetical protein [Paraburkholderia tropica]|uniref:hypothetical protein n=1 Tax=Paraburkholderia tropica TaxID=92647 RepID=UPI003D2CD398
MIESLARKLRLERGLLSTLVIFCGFEGYLGLSGSVSKEETLAIIVSRGLWLLLIIGAFARYKFARNALGFLCAINAIVASLDLMFPTTVNGSPYEPVFLTTSLAVKGSVFVYYSFLMKRMTRAYSPTPDTSVSTAFDTQIGRKVDLLPRGRQVP